MAYSRALEQFSPSTHEAFLDSGSLLKTPAALKSIVGILPQTVAESLYFLHEAAVAGFEIVDAKVECARLGWLERAKTGNGGKLVRQQPQAGACLSERPPRGQGAGFLAPPPGSRVSVSLPAGLW